MQIPEIDEEKCLSLLSSLVQIKSYSETQGEIEITDFITMKMKAIGLEADVFPFADGKRQNAIGRWRGKGNKAIKSNSLLFNGHLDTNPVSEGWTIDPWEGKVDKDFIYGIGVSNMKAGCAAYFCAVETLKSAGWRPNGDIVLTYVVGELQGGIGTISAIKQGRMEADYFINCEPTDIRAVTMHAECLMFEIELTGVTRHMSAREQAADAILAACKIIPALDQMTFTGEKSEEHKKCNRCLVGVVHGALGQDLVEWRPSQVSDFCKLAGSARYAPGQTQESVMKDLTMAIELALKETDVKFVLRQRFEPTMPAFEVSPKARIVESLNKAYRHVREEVQPTGVLAPTCLYGSDAGHLYKSLDMEGIVCGPGGKYNTMPDERVDISDYLDCVRMFIRVIIDICGGS